MPSPSVPSSRILSEEADRLLVRERRLLAHFRELLVANGAAADDLQLLRQAEMDLDELFLLVVVGEFNAGKSAFINALLGERRLREGVTPTTAVITRVRHGPARTERQEGPILEVTTPLEWLRDVAVVDTPGTNAILREHEEITSHFVPRADLILFVTSADRPFTETERAFMERIRTWGKKVVVVLNKADLLATAQELDDQVAFVRSGVERLLGFSPQIFPVSARLALADSEGRDERALREESRFEPLQHFISETLEGMSRVQLKLLTPLGVAERVGRNYVMAAEEKRALLAEDIALAESIESQLGHYRDDMHRDFAFRLKQVDSLLQEMSARGVEYLDETLRLGRVVDLFRQKRLQEEFERIVIADTPDRVDRATQDLVDWMVDQDLKMWRSITEQVDARRRSSPVGGPAERLAGTFEYDRRALLGSLGQIARDVIQRHDHRREAEKLAQSVKGAVTQATLLEGGALGVGAVTMAVAGTAALDVTGLFAASVLAGVGLWVLPRRRKQAKDQFRSRTDDLRTRLQSAMRDQFDRELERSIQRIKDALAPYDRFVRGEHERTQLFLTDLDQTLAEARGLAHDVEALASAPQ